MYLFLPSHRVIYVGRQPLLEPQPGELLSNTMSALEETNIKHYRLLHRLACGGMSEVYLAYDEFKQREIAIKLVNSSNTDYLARFQREITIMSSLKHTHILPVLDFGQHDSWHYMVMPYLTRGSLSKRLAQGSLTQVEAGAILAQIVDALQYMHNQRIIHRDIKAANILLHEDRVYLADFGLAKTLDEEDEITETGCIIGTPDYMAPELANEPASTSADIYALGILLYQMITGEVPFKSSTPLGVYWKHLHEQPPLPSVRNSAISHLVDQVILRALEKDPHQRFQTVQALADAYQWALLATSQPVVVRYMVAYVSSLQASRSLNSSASVPTQQQLRPSVRLFPSRRLRSAPRLPQKFALWAALIALLIVPLYLGFSVSNGLTQAQAPHTLISTSTKIDAPNGTGAGQHQPTPALQQHPTNSAELIISIAVPPSDSNSNSGHGHRYRHRHRRGD